MNSTNFILIGVISYISIMLLGFHQVSQGYIGVYKRFGILQKKLAEPGFHFSIPFVEQFIEIKVTIQTDEVKNVPCGTSNGTLVYFEKIQVVNKLNKDMVYKTLLNYTENYDKFWITDKIHHQINQFCSKHSLQQIYIDIFDKLDQQLMKSLNKDLQVWAPGIQILSIRVTKPNVPERIRRNFEQMERLKVDFFIAAQKQNVLVQEEMTKQKKQVIKMQSDLAVKEIQLQKKIDKKKNSLKMAKIQAQMIFQRQKTKIQTEFLSAFQEAKLYPELYNEKYMSYLAFDALTSNTTFTLGDKVPNIKFDQNRRNRSPKKSNKKVEKKTDNKGRQGTVKPQQNLKKLAKQK